MASFTTQDDLMVETGKKEPYLTDPSFMELPYKSLGVLCIEILQNWAKSSNIFSHTLNVPKL